MARLSRRAEKTNSSVRAADRGRERVVEHQIERDDVLARDAELLARRGRETLASVGREAEERREVLLPVRA